MNVGSVRFLHQLIAMGSRSLLQYVSESFPYAPAAARSHVDRVIALAEEERDEAARLTRLMQKQHLPLPRSVSYPSHFTTTNFASLDYLLPRLIGEHEKEVARIESTSNNLEGEEIRRIGQAYLDMKRRHLQTLRELAGPATASA